MLYPDKCLIMPTINDAKTIASWLKAGCESRGFYVEEPNTEPYLIIFDGYGATHDSTRRFFSLKRISKCFIIQKNGDVSLSIERSKLLEKVFPENDANLFKRIAFLCENDFPVALPLE